MTSIQEIKHTAHEALQRQGRDDMLNALDKMAFIREVNRIWGEARRDSDHPENVPYISAYRAGAYDIFRVVSAVNTIRTDGSPVITQNYSPELVQEFIDKDVRFNKTGSELEQPTGTPSTLTREAQTADSQKRSGRPSNG